MSSLEISSPLKPPPVGGMVWLTGVPGVGKSTLATAIQTLASTERRIEILDADVVRPNLWPELGFSPEARRENARRLGFVGSRLALHGALVLVAAISPYASSRSLVREDAERAGIPFVLIHLSARMEVLVARDPKGHYRRALSGELSQFTGVSSPYEVPTDADLVLRTDCEDVVTSANKAIDYLRSRRLLHRLR